MRKSRRPIVIASRKSTLARKQAQLVGNALGQLNPHVQVEYRWIESQGDQLADVSLADVGGKDLFTHAIERALLLEQADIAVHSLKDLPAGDLTQGLTIAAIPNRSDVRDCLVTHTDATQIADLPVGATVGTSSPRRTAQLLSLRSDLNIILLRGNIQTRIAKVKEERQCDATLLAAAGLLRGGLAEHAGNKIDTSIMLPAVGQGALAVQCRADDHVTIRRCLPLNDPITAAAVHGERRIVAGLEGDCHSPIAVLATPLGVQGCDGFAVQVKVFSPDGSRCIEASETTTPKQLNKLPIRMVEDLLKRGARELLALPALAPASVVGSGSV